MKATQMPRTTCNNCSNDYDWSWTDAFDKFGFGDGDGQIMTGDVVEVLREAGYTVVDEPWGLHNITICSIKRNGIEQIPHDRIKYGYDDPRSYLPAEIIQLLDAKLPELGEVVS
jgi:hypothetical protein